MKIKYKFKAAFMAAFSSLILLATSLTASAAWDGLAGGTTGSGGFTLTNTPYGILTKNDVFAWRVDMYVSANPDGKINKAVDKIGSDQLPLVGSLLCISEKYGRESWPTYLQTNYTNQTRTTISGTGKLTSTDSNGDITGSLAGYALPTLEQFNPADTAYPDASDHTVAIAAKLPNKPGVNLFDGQYGINTTFTSVATKLTTDSTYANDRTTEILQQLLKKDKGFALRVATELSNKCPNYYNSIKAKTGDKFTEETLYRYLLPTNPVDSTQSSPMVEWAMVITPLYRFECNAPFYCSSSSSVTTSNNGTKYVGGGDCVALDAYWFAQSNVTSTALGKAGMYAGLTYKSGETTKSVWQNQSNGLLYYYLNDVGSTKNGGAPAAAAYCTQPENEFLGVYTNRIGNSQITNQSDWGKLLAATSSPSEYAKRGGIAVFKAEISLVERSIRCIIHIFVQTRFLEATKC